MSMEYRTWVTLANVPLEADDLWLPLMNVLESGPASELGPVISWQAETTAQIVMSLDAESPSAAASRVVGILVEALQQVGLADRFPGAIEVEPAGELAAA
jgi:hypothetical protein